MPSGISASAQQCTRPLDTAQARVINHACIIAVAFIGWKSSEARSELLAVTLQTGLLAFLSDK
eukprot:1605822-Amphidinium_carterae.1